MPETVCLECLQLISVAGDTAPFVEVLLLLVCMSLLQSCPQGRQMSLGLQRYVVTGEASVM
jgi:hypothetical protein